MSALVNTSAERLAKRVAESYEREIEDAIYLEMMKVADATVRKVARELASHLHVQVKQYTDPGGMELKMLISLDGVREAVLSL